MMEAMAALVLVIQRYRVVALPGARIRARPLLTLRLDPCLPVRIEQRERNARWAADAFPHRSGISAHGPRS
jgi:hypothetical protein